MFPARHGLSSYVLFRRNLVFKGLFRSLTFTHIFRGLDRCKGFTKSGPLCSVSYFASLHSKPATELPSQTTTSCRLFTTAALHVWHRHCEDVPSRSDKGRTCRGFMMIIMGYRFRFSWFSSVFPAGCSDNTYLPLGVSYRSHHCVNSAVDKVYS
jgi:hypothetical protein